MANAAGFIQESIWRDPHWRKLSRSAQALYLQLLSQKELDCAGILPLQPNKWAKGCEGLTVEQVWSDLKELRAERFVFFDTETDEAFVRTYIRNSNVIKVPNMLKSARRAAALVGSEEIRPLLAAELRATGNVECIATADQINPSETVSEPLENPSKSTLPEPFVEPTGVGTGVGEPTLVSSSVGEARPKCSKHETNSDTEACIPCMKREKWDKAHPEYFAQIEAAEKKRRIALRENCPRCEGMNTYTDAEGKVRPCRPHITLEEAAHA